jgi:arylsulfatase A-like enzyme
MSPTHAPAPRSPRPYASFTTDDSVPGEYPLSHPGQDAPNVVVIVLDDLGFGQLGCFGSDVATPNIDRLATEGLAYNRFHVTAICSPTRACLLTGRNHHAVGMGFLTDMPMAYPGYTARVPKSAATLPRVLRDAGYNTMAVGKWHLVTGGERSHAGPFDRWPLGFGFERYYGFLQGDTNHWSPNLVRDNHYVGTPRPSAPSSSTGRSARSMRRTTWRRSGSRRTAGGSTRVGSAGARRRSRASRRAASCRSTPSCRRARAGCRTGTR